MLSFYKTPGTLSYIFSLYGVALERSWSFFKLAWRSLLLQFLLVFAASMLFIFFILLPVMHYVGHFVYLLGQGTLDVKLKDGVITAGGFLYGTPAREMGLKILAIAVPIFLLLIIMLTFRGTTALHWFRATHNDMTLGVDKPLDMPLKRDGGAGLWPFQSLWIKAVFVLFLANVLASIGINVFNSVFQGTFLYLHLLSSSFASPFFRIFTLSLLPLAIFALLLLIFFLAVLSMRVRLMSVGFLVSPPQTTRASWLLSTSRRLWFKLFVFEVGYMLPVIFFNLLLAVVLFFFLVCSVFLWRVSPAFIQDTQTTLWPFFQNIIAHLHIAYVSGGALNLHVSTESQNAIAHDIVNFLSNKEFFHRLYPVFFQKSHTLFLVVGVLLFDVLSVVLINFAVLLQAWVLVGLRVRLKQEP